MLDEVEHRDGVPYEKSSGKQLIAEVGKMSKSHFNVVPPDELIARYGADTERVYTLFIAPPDKEAAWSDEGVVGASRFLGRVWNMAAQIADSRQQTAGDARLTRKMHQTIDAVTQRMVRFEFNTAISFLMELSNAIGEHVTASNAREAYLTLLQMLHPFAPHVTEELWQMLGQSGFILTSKWPVADPALMQEDVVTLAVQVNGKLRGQVDVANPPEPADAIAAAKSNENVRKWIDGKEIVKEIYVPGKLVNIVVK